MLGLTPLKLLNLAQLGLISRFIFNQNNFSSYVSDKVLPHNTKFGGGVMIFLGKPTIQLVPDSKSASSNFTVRKMEQMTNYVNKTKNLNIDKKKSLNKPQSYWMVRNQPLNGTVKMSMNPGTNRQTAATLAPSPPKEANASGHQTIYFLPYSKRHNQIHFFDFVHEFDKKNDLMAEKNEDGVNNESDVLHMPSLIKSITRFLPLIASKVTEADLQLYVSKLDRLISDQSLLGKWLRYVLRKRYVTQQNQLYN